MIRRQKVEMGSSNSRKRWLHSSVYLLAILPVALFACRHAVSEGASGKKRPNFLIVLADTLRPDHLGLYGHPEPTSPYLDAIAKESVVFESAFSHAPQTLLSTASLFTSQLFPDVVGLGETHDLELTARELWVLAPLGPTFLDLLAENGYSTVAIFSNPLHHQFSGFTKLFQNPILRIAPAKWQKRSYYRGDEINRAYLDWLADFDDTESPFLAYVHYMDAHNPYRPPRKWADLFVTSQGKDRYRNGRPPPDNRPSDEDILFMKQSYNGEIRFVDSLVHEIHQATLEHCTRDTILIFTSDHGEEFMDHGGLGHGKTLEKEQLWVPLLMHGLPNQQPLRYEGLVRQVDIGPTLLELAGLSSPEEWDGQSFLSYLGQPEGSSNEQIVVARRYGFRLSMTSTQWHFIWDPKRDVYNLYDNKNDKAGLKDIAEEKPEEVRRLKNMLRPFANRYRVAFARQEALRRDLLASQHPAAPPEEVIQQLEALGYL